MLGKRSGVAAQIKLIQPKAEETHFHGHYLNLSVKDVTQDCKILKDTIGIVGEIYVLDKYSPKREILLGEIQRYIEEVVEDELDKLCLTRWTVRAKCYKKVITNYGGLPLYHVAISYFTFINEEQITQSAS